ncbi:hypothetical protein FIBSPDRAFT_127397 [Athelia psychrophila]|uniref:Uncharacterized protein n=1 Tax=Athelia psychrophila TaxID=1759441 RepID=A0A166T8A2_9AGAM|nr:hypothetical protein FIBSPDRAFT_127397 [Fibularhizoctonia sp. CBS 109695]
MRARRQMKYIYGILASSIASLARCVLFSYFSSRRSASSSMAFAARNGALHNLALANAHSVDFPRTTRAYFNPSSAVCEEGLRLKVSSLPASKGVIPFSTQLQHARLPRRSLLSKPRPRK